MRCFCRLTAFVVVSALVGGTTQPAAMAQEPPAPATTPAASSAALTAAEVATIQAQLRSSEHLQVRFTQTTFRSLRQRTATAAGQAYFSKPNHFRWIITEPEPAEWLYNGKQLHHYLPSRQQASKYPIGGGKGRELLQLVDMVLNFETLLTKFTLAAASRAGDLVQIELKPQTPGEVEVARLAVDLNGNYVTQVHLVFPDGNTTTLDFHEPQRGKIDRDRYELPKNTKISEAF